MEAIDPVAINIVGRTAWVFFCQVTMAVAEEATTPPTQPHRWRG